MRKVTPYKTTKNALASLDNGGRFYNFLSKANDGDITSAELAKAAGVFGGTQKMMLFFEMSMMALAEDQRETVVGNLSDELKRGYERFAPQHLIPSRANQEGRVSSNAIITGVPRQVDSKTEFKGFIMIPIMTGNVTTFTMIPIIDQYNIYELRDDETSEEFIIAHTRGRYTFPERQVRCAGVLKELKTGKGKQEGSRLFLETLYYTPLS